MQLSPLSKLIPTFGSPTLEGGYDVGVQDGQRLKTTGRQYVRFYSKIVPEVYATEVKINPKTGSTTVLKTAIRDVTREFVEIITPGDKNTVDDFAEDFHKREHWKEYKAFRDGDIAPRGKSLEECSYVSPHVVTELNYRKCFTMEQLADASDLLCGQIPDGQMLREFARAEAKALIDNKTNGEVGILSRKLEETQAQLAELQLQMREGSTPKRMGRPPKIHTDETTEIE